MPDPSGIGANVGDPTTRSYYDGLFEQLRTERSSYRDYWEDLRAYINPYRGRFEGEGRSDPGTRRDCKIYNPTPVTYARMMAHGLTSGIVTKSRPWFTLTPSEKDLKENKAVETWLFDLEDNIRTILARSNFYEQVFTLFEDLVTFGTGAMAVEHNDTIGIYFHTMSIGEYYLATSHPDRMVNTYAREFLMTPAQCVAEFGIDKVSQEVKSSLKTNAKERTDIIVRHVIEPNISLETGKVGSKGKLFRSVYYEAGEGQTGSATPAAFLRESGFNTFPIMAPRWSVASSEVYGTSCPGMWNLGDSKQLQTQEHVKQDGMQRNVNPPMVAPYDMQNSKINNIPGGVSFSYNAGTTTGIRPLFATQVNLQELGEDIARTENRLRQGFMIDLFASILSANRPSDMKAAVAGLMDTERMLLLGAALERLHNELLDPMIKRVISIMHEYDLLADVPVEIDLSKSGQLKIEYTSILAQVQKAVGVGGIERIMGLVGQLSTMKPDVVDKVDFDSVVERVAGMLGGPPDMIRSDKAVAEIRNVRVNQEQQQQQLETIPAAAKAASDLTKAGASAGAQASLLPNI